MRRTEKTVRASAEDNTIAEDFHVKRTKGWYRGFRRQQILQRIVWLEAQNQGLAVQ